MQFLDVQSPPPPAAEESQDGYVWGGEPEAHIDRPTAQQIFEELERSLVDVSVVRVTHPEWMIGDWCAEFERVLASFRARGGTVVFT